MGSTITLTAFEEQVFHVLGAIYYPEIPDLPSSVDVLQELGEQMFGEGWGGAAQPRNLLSAPNYPQLNLALARLEKKGCIERCPSIEKEYGYAASTWKLTMSGKQVLGIDTV